MPSSPLEYPVVLGRPPCSNHWTVRGALVQSIGRDERPFSEPEAVAAPEGESPEGGHAPQPFALGDGLQPPRRARRPAECKPVAPLAAVIEGPVLIRLNELILKCPRVPRFDLKVSFDATILLIQRRQCHATFHS